MMVKHNDFYHLERSYGTESLVQNLSIRRPLVVLMTIQSQGPSNWVEDIGPRPLVWSGSDHRAPVTQCIVQGRAH